MAKFYGIGIGPGSKDLMTLKAVETLKNIDVVYTPITRSGRRSFALSVAEDCIGENTRIEKRLFPLTRDLQINEPAWKEIARDIEKELDAGNDVAFITLGDPSTYSTFSYIVKYMEPGYEIETIAGISSYHQISGIFNRALALDDEAFVVIPATAEEKKLENALENFDTIVILKIANHLAKILPIIKAHGLEDKAFIVSKASGEDEEIISIKDLNEDSKIHYFSTMIIYNSSWWDINEG